VPSHSEALEDKAEAACGIFIKRKPQTDKPEKALGWQLSTVRGHDMQLIIVEH
jgi:hypothetical protein